MLNVIDYIPGTTPLHRLNPVAKLALACGVIAATFLSTTFPLLVSLLALTLVVATWVGAMRQILGLLKLLVPIAAVMLAVQLALVREGTVLAGFVTAGGLDIGGKACLRLLGVALPLVLMLMLTKTTDLANACVEVLRIPYRYAFTFTTALRFVPVFSQEMDAIMEAQTARGVEFDTKNPFKKMSLMLPVCIPLLVTSVSKADATALAAEQRGFYLRTRASSYKRYSLKAADFMALAAALMLIALGILF